jgi:hypothetical protein
MIRKLFIFFLLTTALNTVFAQRVPSVGITVFEVYGAGVTAAEAANITNRVASELTSWGTLNVVQGSTGAEYIVSATISRQGNSFILQGKTVEAATERVLNEYREQVDVDNISVFTFCARAVDRVPFPNYLLGTWQATINMPDGPVVCIIEFKSDRTVTVERYDTWEHKQLNALRYEGYGNGTYSYAGYANRVVTVNAQQVRIDATININLTLEETLPEQTEVDKTGLFFVFNGNKSAFDIINDTLPCGQNFDGPSVYHSDSLGFTSFTKIR